MNEEAHTVRLKRIDFIGLHARCIEHDGRRLIGVNFSPQGSHVIKVTIHPDFGKALDLSISLDGGPSKKIQGHIYRAIQRKHDSTPVQMSDALDVDETVVQ